MLEIKNCVNSYRFKQYLHRRERKKPIWFFIQEALSWSLFIVISQHRLLELPHWWKIKALFASSMAFSSTEKAHRDHAFGHTCRAFGLWKPIVDWNVIIKIMWFARDFFLLLIWFMWPLTIGFVYRIAIVGVTANPDYKRVGRQYSISKTLPQFAFFVIRTFTTNYLLFLDGNALLVPIFWA